MPYHKGPGIKKSGPKGPWKAKGKVLDLIIKLSEDEPQLTSEAIAERVGMKTGVSLTARRIRQIRHEVGEKSLMRRNNTEAPYLVTPASRSLSLFSSRSSARASSPSSRT